MSDIGKAYVQIVPKAEGISGSVTKILDGEATSAGKSAGLKIASGIGTGLKVAGAAAIASTAAVGAFAKSAIDAGSSFDTSMSQVAATMGTTTDQIGNLRDFAQEMGRTTAFSATQAADALNYMALAGYSADQSMEMLPTVLDLAAAGGLELATASDMVTDAQTALGLSFQETSTMVDQMAKTASKSNTSVGQLGDAFLKIGANARNVKGGTQELATVLGVLADNGIKGTEAGTHLRNIMLAMNPTTDDAVAAWTKLGVSAYDAEGNLRALPDVFQDLNKAMEGMTQQEKTQLFSDMFNKTDLASIQALVGTTSDRYEELSAAIGDANGAAKEMAATQLDNLAGDVTLFKSALEGAQIAVSDALTPALREFVQFGTEGMSQLGEAFANDGIQGAATAFGDILSEGLTLIISKLPEFTSAGISVLQALIDGLIQNLPMILSAGTQIAGQIGQALITAAPTLLDAIHNIFATVAQNLGSALPTLIPAIVNLLMDIADVVISNAPMMLEAGISLITGLAEGFLAALPVFISRLPELIQGIVTALVNELPMLIQGAITLVNGIVTALPEIILALVDALPQIIEAIVNGLITCLPILIEGHIQLITALAAALPEICMALIEAIPQIITTIVNTIVEHGPEFIMAVMTIGQMITQTVIQLGATLLTTVGTNLMNLLTTVTTYLSQLPTQAAQFAGLMVGQFITFVSQLPQKAMEVFNKVLTNVQNFGQKFIAEGPKMANEFKSKLIEIMMTIPSKMIEIGSDIVEGLKNGVASAWDSFKSWMGEMVSGFIEGVKAGLKIGSPSKVMADEIGRWIPAGIAMGIEQNQGVIEQAMSGMAMNIVPYDSTGAAMQGLNKAVSDGKNVNVTVVLEGDADRLFRVMQSKATANYRLTGNSTLVTV